MEEGGVNTLNGALRPLCGRRMNRCILQLMDVIWSTMERYGSVRAIVMA